MWTGVDGGGGIGCPRWTVCSGLANKRKHTTEVRTSFGHISTRPASYLQAPLRNVWLEDPSFRRAYIEFQIHWLGVQMMLASELFSRAPVESVSPRRVVM